MNTDHKTNTVTTRIPPSPTGHLHIGTARTALYNFLFAKASNGNFVFRSEDTDKARSTKESEQEIITGLQELGIVWDNDPIIRQSERAQVYRSYLEQLIANDTAYISTEPSKEDETKTVDLIRLRNPNKTITFTDLIRGEISFDTTELGDFIIARSIDDALYHFTVVVDDAEMGVTHILRGEDHISNTPRQILIQESLGFSRPQYAHLPLILAPDRSKMSKRHGAVAIKEYRAQGFLPETIVNYLALLGWNPGTEQEFFTLDELITSFSVEKIHKAGAIFDIAKMTWLNKLHLQKLSTEAQTAYVLEAITQAESVLDEEVVNRFTKLVPTILERFHTSAAITEAVREGEFDYVFNQPITQSEKLQWKKDTDPTAYLTRLAYVQELLEQADFSTPDTIKATVWPYAEKEGKGEVLWPLRMALTGQDKSPDPFTVAFVLGSVETKLRIEKACGKIES